MKVWLVWSGEYAEACVIGVYSTKELADAAASMNGRSSFTDKPDGYVSPEEGCEVDEGAAMVLAGLSRWRVDIGVDDGAVTWFYELSLGTGAPPSAHEAFIATQGRGPQLVTECDARDKDGAAKIAAEERAAYLARQRKD